MKTRLLARLIPVLLFCCVGPHCIAAEIGAVSGPGKRFVGDQLRAFTVENDGTIAATRDAWINLYYTEGAAFRLSGKVWLGGPSETLAFPRDMPDGFALFLREWDSLHRYSLTSRAMWDKRRLLGGAKEKKILMVGEFQPPAIGEWVSFSVEARPDRIIFQLGKYTGTIKGPLDMDGANKIALAKGTKIKDVQLEILEADAKPVSSAAAPSTTSPAKASVEDVNAGGPNVQAAVESGKLAVSFHTVPGKTYRLVFKNDLTDLTWTPLGEPVKATGPSLVVRDDANQPQRFYTVVEEP